MEQEIIGQASGFVWHNLSTAFGLMIVGFVMAFANYYIERRKAYWAKEDAFQRLDDNKNFHIGAEFHCIIDTNGASIFGPGKIDSWAVGHVGVASRDEKCFMNFTGQEFEAMHPKWVCED